MRRTVVAFEGDEFDALYHTGWSVLAIGQATDVTDNLDLIAGDARVRPWAGGERLNYVTVEAEILVGPGNQQRVVNSSVRSESTSDHGGSTTNTIHPPRGAEAVDEPVVRPIRDLRLCWAACRRAIIDMLRRTEATKPNGF